jgi:hypothetical protein
MTNNEIVLLVAYIAMCICAAFLFYKTLDQRDEIRTLWKYSLEYENKSRAWNSLFSLLKNRNDSIQIRYNGQTIYIFRYSNGNWWAIQDGIDYIEADTPYHAFFNWKKWKGIND